VTRPVVLFACVHNSGRSVAAKVLTEHYAAGAVGVRSAGSEPGREINPVVAQVLAERGFGVRGETCPVFPGKRYEDWAVEDPAGQDLETVRRIVDDIDRRVQRMVSEMVRTE
jgi:arsenate reductase (thioredoxin)